MGLGLRRGTRRQPWHPGHGEGGPSLLCRCGSRPGWARANLPGPHSLRECWPPDQTSGHTTPPTDMEPPTFTDPPRPPTYKDSPPGRQRHPNRHMHQHPDTQTHGYQPSNFQDWSTNGSTLTHILFQSYGFFFFFYILANDTDF